ncbi:MAG: hypothetical protein LC732_05840 [Acidobacteria bacterium]|nr:hypothetical protein [Acidobacteriota bacterium]
MINLAAPFLRPDRLTPDQKQLVQRRSGMELSRKRVLHDLDSSTNPSYRDSLKAGLTYLEKEIAEMDRTILAIGEEQKETADTARRARTNKKH